MHELLERSATELARRIRNRELASRELAEPHIDRTREVNGRLDAIVAPRFGVGSDIGGSIRMGRGLHAV